MRRIAATPFQDVHHSDQDGGAGAESAHDVGRAGLAAALRARVHVAEEPGDDHAAGDRAEEIAEGEGYEESKNVGARHRRILSTEETAITARGEGVPRRTNATLRTRRRQR